MNMKIVLAIVCTCAFFGNTFALTTIGVPSCLDWNETRRQSEYGKNSDAEVTVLIAELSNQSFVMGYVNAFAVHLSLSQGIDILKTVTKESVLNFIDEECKKKPTQDVSVPAFTFVLKRMTAK